MCDGVGPGPGAYMLPKETGYEKHDPSRYRNPQYSMAPRLAGIGKGLGPGPSHDPGRMTRYGPATSPAYSLKSRLRDLPPFSGPSPDTYTLHQKQQNPAYSIYSRLGDLSRSQMPAPNAYTLPSMLGPKIPNKIAGYAYSLRGNNGLSSKNKSPGPAAYNEISANVYKYRGPIYSMKPRVQFNKCQQNPGPAAYLPKLPRKCLGGFSFGVRLGCKSRPYITADDAMPCIIHEK